MTIAELFSRLREHHIQVSTDSSQLVVKAPPGSLTAELRGELTARKNEILRFLNDASNSTQLDPPLERAPRDRTLPLSFAQERLWFLDQYEPGSSVYNLRSAVRLRGSLNTEFLQRSLNEIIRRHESLRTTFSMVDGEPVQVISPSTSISLDVVTLTERTEREREEEARQLVTEEGRRPFDLKKGPLFRSKLLQLSEDDHVLLLTMHHIVSDDWSIGVLYHELSTHYRAFVNGQPSPLPELEIQYADFAVWQRKWLQGRVLKRQVGYWKKQLAEAPAIASLPTDRPRPAVQTHRGARQAFAISTELTEQLKGLSRKEGATLFMTLLAVFQVLLYRQTGEEDVVVGSPIANRNRAEIEGLIGFFVNTLVLRTNLSGNPSFTELLSRVREMALAAYAHQDLPFEKLLQELKPGRDLSRTPLFQVFFNMVSGERSSIEMPGLKTETVPGSTANVNSKFDLTIYTWDQGGDLQFDWVYNADLFDDTRILELSKQYEKLLSQVVENPDRKISSFSLITSSAEKLLPNPAESLGSDWAGSVHERLSHQAARLPNHSAVTDSHVRWSYAQLNSRANQLAHYLLENGIQREEVVAIYAHRDAALVLAMMGTLKAGAAFLILDPAYPATRLMSYVRASKPRALIQLAAAGAIPSEIEALIETNLRCRIILPRLSRGELTDLLESYSQEDPKIPIGPDDLACVSFTSGSTGEPKGILGRHGPLSHFLPWQSAKFSLTSSDRFSALSGLSHDPLQREAFTSLWVGATICIPDPDVLTSPGDLAKWMVEREITFAHLTPALGRVLTETADHNCRLSSLRHAFLVGDKLTWADVNRLHRLAPNVMCVNYYGSTETQRAVSYYEVPRDVTDLYRNPVVPVGRGAPDVQLLILNRDLKMAGIGELGEIYIRSPHVARGYLRDAALTQKRFIDNPFTEQPHDKLYRTGDLGRYLPDGNVEILGRRDGQVKIRGFRVELGEIESVLSRHPAVKETVVAARDDIEHAVSESENSQAEIRTPKFSNKRLVAYVVPRQGASRSAHDLRVHLQQQLPKYMVPSAFVFLNSLPLTPNGKIDRKALPVPDQNSSMPQHTYIAPRTPLEKAIAEIWADLLRLERVGIHDNFFDIGGHSLLAVSLFAELERKIGKKLPLAILFQAPTIEELANLLGRNNWSPSWACLVPIQPKGSRPPFFCVHAHGGNVLNFKDLARHLSVDQPFYGIQAQGLESGGPRNTTIEAMAAHYVKEIRHFQPSGPYLLGGHCFGGKVAFEMAQQLRKQGEEVLLLALIDSYAPGYPQLLPWKERRAAQIRLHWSNLSKLRSSERLSYVHMKGRIAGARAAETAKRIASKACMRLGLSLPAALQGTPRRRLRLRYNPSIYNGKLHVFAPSEGPSIIRIHEPSMGWEGLAGQGLEINVIPGKFASIILEPSVKVLAERLQSAIDAALGNRKGHTRVPVA